MPLTLPQRAATGGTVASAPTLPLASEPANKALVNKPTVQPLGAAPTAPTLPLAPAPASGGRATAGQGISESAPRTQITEDGQQSKTDSGNPSPPPAPGPYQTNDPLAFAPAPTSPTPEQLEGPHLSAPFSDLPEGFGQPRQPGQTISAPATPLDTNPATQPPQGGFFSASPESIVTDYITKPPPVNTLTTPTPTLFNTPDSFGAGILPPDIAAAIGLSSSSVANGAANLTPTTPDNALTNYTITPGAGVDRYGIANDLLSQWDANEKPQFDSQIKALAQNAAGAGQLGSGMVRGSFRDALNDEQTRRTTAQRGFLTDALGGSVEDAYRSIGILQQQQQQQQSQQESGFNQQVSLQQLSDSEQGQNFQQQMAAQGFNAQQMQAAFENAYKVQQLSDDETGQAFYTALQQAIYGSQGDPAQMAQWFAQLQDQLAGNYHA